MSSQVEQALDAAEVAQQEWSNVVLRQRVKVVGGLRAHLCEHFEEFLSVIERPNASRADIMSSEMIPLADACRMVAKKGRQILAPQTHSWRDAAFWMGRIRVRTLHEPWGVVLILAPSNYPLYLPGVQMIQALAAGNAVIVKPALHGTAVIERLKQALIGCGLPEDLVQVLPEGIEYGEEAIDAGVDKVVLTGSVHTGRAVLRRTAETITPTTMELSGCDAVFISSRGDLERAVSCVAYALLMNGGATCIAPRRIFVAPSHLEDFKSLLVNELNTRLEGTTKRTFSIPVPVASAVRRAAEQALSQGASIAFGEIPEDTRGPDGSRAEMGPLVLQDVLPRMEAARTDLFAPITSIIAADDMRAAINADRVCPYSLGASIFAPQSFADHWAEEIEAGCIVINDIIVPTADPRVSFGGCDQSGWGVTRGPLGLLEMTRPKVICSRRGKWLPHLDEQAANLEMLSSLMSFFHQSSLRNRFAALKKVLASARKSAESKS
ncbi:MAG: aldehyde dehydrogenase family protein [Aureliella sp.]